MLMKKNTQIIQYLPLTRPRASHRYVHKLAKMNVMSILDLEDSAQNPFNLEETRTLKQSARDGLVFISKNCKWENLPQVFVRINSLDTEYFEEDIKTVIAAVKNKMPIQGIFFPKVESYAQIEKLHSCFKNLDTPLEIVPMVETNNGLLNLPQLLEDDKNKKLFSRIHYGHFDYCLDAKVWPFSAPNYKTFWDNVKYIVMLLEKHNKGYIHTPFPFLYDTELFWQATDYLSTLTDKIELWSCTLNSELSLSSRPENLKELEIINPKMFDEGKISEAQEVCKAFLDGRANDRSFGVSKTRFIPPHQYFAAQNYLRSMGKNSMTSKQTEGNKEI
jgi:citrate lyase beta subunit